MRPTTALIPTVLPSSTTISARVPALGDGISVSTLSVEISNSGSSRSTRSPVFFNHLVNVPSTMLSPIWGITTSVMSVLTFSGRKDRVLVQQFAIENFAEVGGEAAAHLGQRRRGAELGHGSDGLGEAAGNDVMEIAQIGGDVQRETVRSHPTADVHADGG